MSVVTDFRKDKNNENNENRSVIQVSICWSIKTIELVDLQDSDSFISIEPKDIDDLCIALQEAKTLLQKKVTKKTTRKKK